MAGSEIIRALLQQASAKGTKSNILNPLAWLIGILLTAIIGSNTLGSPSWISILLAGFLVLIIILFLFSYTYCLFVDRDALRSEKYSIQKLAIEKGFLGDDITGTIKRELLDSSTENADYEIANSSGDIK